MPYSSTNIQGGNLGPGDFRAANPALQADDKSIAFLIKYIGSQASGLVEVASGDIIFTHGAVGAEASDATVGNATTGRIDISNAAEDTVAEALALINQSANWIAVAVDAVGSDAIGTSAELLTAAATQAKVAKGIPVYWDTTAKMNDTVLVAPNALRTDIRPYYAPENDEKVDAMRPFKGTAAKVFNINATSTYASGTSDIQILSDPDPEGTSSTVDRVVAGGDTTVRKEVDWSNAPYEGERGRRILVRISNSAAQSAVELAVSGELFRKLN